MVNACPRDELDNGASNNRGSEGQVRGESSESLSGVVDKSGSPRTGSKCRVWETAQRAPFAEGLSVLENGWMHSILHKIFNEVRSESESDSFHWTGIGLGRKKVGFQPTRRQGSHAIPRVIADQLGTGQLPRCESSTPPNQTGAGQLQQSSRDFSQSQLCESAAYRHSLERRKSRKLY
jgi:hypothetical protein